MTKVLGWLVWLFMFIGALNWGLDAFGWNLFTWNLFMVDPMTGTGGMLAYLVQPVKIVVGASALISFFMVLSGKSCDSCK